MYLNTDQLSQLLKPLDRNRVKERQGNSYLEAWDVRRWLNRIFGIARWSFAVVTHELAFETINGTRYTVGYRCVGRLTVLHPDTGEILSYWEDAAIGVAHNQPNQGDAHDLATKAAVSDALKRCAVNLGDQFGLSLYDDGSIEAVVGATLQVTPEPEIPVDSPEPVELPLLDDDGGDDYNDTLDHDEPDRDDPVNVFTTVLLNLAKMPDRKERMKRTTETALAVGKAGISTAMTSEGVTIGVLIDRALAGVK